MGKAKGEIKRRSTSKPMPVPHEGTPRLQRRGTSEPLEERRTGFSAQQAAQAENIASRLNLTRNSINLEDMKGNNPNKKVIVPKLAAKKAEAIKTNLPSERVKSSTPQKSMGQIGREMAKSGPRKNLRETVASVKGKLQNAYRKATGRKSVSGEMDGKTFTGYEKSNMRKAVVKVSNPTSGSSKMVDKFDRSGKLKSQKIVDRNASGKKMQVIKKKY